MKSLFDSKQNPAVLIPHTTLRDTLLPKLMSEELAIQQPETELP
jgi:hypothetical protein